MKIKKISVPDIIKKIENEELFEVLSDDGGLKVKISKYVPFCCTAIHNGSHIRQELLKKIALNDYQRWYEEDPYTGDFIASMPISIIGNDSRFEYELNRNPSECIYTKAWEKQVWKRKLTEREVKLSRQKHAKYYQVLHHLI